MVYQHITTAVFGETHGFDLNRQTAIFQLRYKQTKRLSHMLLLRSVVQLYLFFSLGILQCGQWCRIGLVLISFFVVGIVANEVADAIDAY